MSSAAEIWTEYQELKASDAPLTLRGRVYERWFARAFREGNDPSQLWQGHVTKEARLLPWTPPCTCYGCRTLRARTA